MSLGAQTRQAAAPPAPHRKAVAGVAVPPPRLIANWAFGLSLLHYTDDDAAFRQALAGATVCDLAVLDRKWAQIIMLDVAACTAFDQRVHRAGAPGAPEGC